MSYEPAPLGRVEAMWERLGSVGSEESMGRSMLETGVGAVLRMAIMSITMALIDQIDPRKQG